MVTGSSHSINMCPPHSPTRITKKSILKLPGAFHWPKTSRIRFWAFSYSIGEPCGRSNQLITYFIGILLIVLVLGMLQAGGEADLALEPLGAKREGKLWAKDFERHVAVVLEVLRQVHRGHAA